MLARLPLGGWRRQPIRQVGEVRGSGWSTPGLSELIPITERALLSACRASSSQSREQERDAAPLSQRRERGLRPGQGHPSPATYDEGETPEAPTLDVRSARVACSARPP